MTDARMSRRLAAILAADVVGYSRLMNADEGGTFARVKAVMREIVDPVVEEAGGAVVKTTGDGVLAAFPSVVEALTAAIRIQTDLAARENGGPADRRIQLRIGLNVGDIIVDDDDIYGDGVNIAARLETLAPPGGICVSRAVRDAAPNSLRIAFEDLGEQHVKNIDKPIRVFRVSDPQVMALAAAAAAAEGEAGPEAPRSTVPRPLAATRSGPPRPVEAPKRRGGLAPLWLLLILVLGVGGVIAVKVPWTEDAGLGPDTTPPIDQRPPDAPPLDEMSPEARRLLSSDRPTLALMPFDGPGLGNTKAWLPGSLQDAAMAKLERFQSIAAIARGSIDAYKGARDPKAISRMFGARWIAEVKVAEANGRVTLTLRMSDGNGGIAIDGDTFTRPASQVASLVDELVRRIVRQMSGSLSDEEIGTTLHERRGTSLVAMSRLEAEARLRDGDVSGAYDLFHAAAAADPDDAEAYRGLSESLFRAWLRPQQGTLAGQQGRPETLQEAVSVAKLATETDPGSPRAFAQYAWVLAWANQAGEALAAAETARSLDPSSADARLALVLLDGGRAETALRFLDRLAEIDPLHDARADAWRGLAELALGRRDQAERTLAACIGETPSEPLCPALQAGVLALAGKLEAAREQVQALTGRAPGFRLIADAAPDLALLRGRPEFEALFAAMRRAGVQD